MTADPAELHAMIRRHRDALDRAEETASAIRHAAGMPSDVSVTRTVLALAAMSQDENLTAAGAARMLGVSRQCLYQSHGFTAGAARIRAARRRIRETSANQI